eukprot:4207213-Amphidinium_carterae.1
MMCILYVWMTSIRFGGLLFPPLVVLHEQTSMKPANVDASELELDLGLIPASVMSSHVRHKPMFKRGMQA